MILSMTGYGEAQRFEGGVRYALEIRSVNNRYFKAAIKLPDGAQFLEQDIDKMLRAKLVRGSVTVNLRIRNENATAAYSVNREALAAYVDALSSAVPPDGVRTAIDLAALSTLPGVCMTPELDEDERAGRTTVICEMAEQALDQLIQMRRREGQALHDDLIQNCDGIRAQLVAVDERAPGVLQEYHERLAARTKVLLGNGKLQLDPDAICREVALYAERSDISEEIVRLRAHLDHFLELCDMGEAIGRKLDFLAQEMLREANTIGSKSNDAAIARAVIEMKATIDRIKEQVQNAE